MIDPTLLHYCYAFVSSHVFGVRPEGIVTVTELESVRFQEVKERLQSYLESQVRTRMYGQLFPVYFLPLNNVTIFEKCSKIDW